MDTYKILLIDLKDLSYRTIEVDKDTSYKYIGGYSMGLYVFSNLIDLSTKPFGIFSSIFKDVDTLARTSYMYYENELIASSMGGDFSSHLNTISIDAIVVINESKTVKSIEISKNKVTFYEASGQTSLNNNETYSLLSNKYDNFSSVYVSKSAFNKNYYSRLINDRVHGVSKGLGYYLAKKNIKSISINSKKTNRDFNYQGKMGYINCPSCPIGCKNSYKKTRDTIFDEELKKKIDDYGLDSIALSKSIEYAKEYLNDTYHIGDLNNKNLNNILKNIEDDVYPYSSLANGIDYIKSDKTKKNNERKENKFTDLAKIADSLGICLFVFENYNFSYIENFVRKYSSFDIRKGRLYELLIEIKDLENRL